MPSNPDCGPRPGEQQKATAASELGRTRQRPPSSFERLDGAFGLRDLGAAVRNLFRNCWNLTPRVDADPPEAPQSQFPTFQRWGEATATAIRESDRLEFWEVLQNAQVQERWDALITGATGRAEDILKHTTELIEATEVPDTSTKRRKVTPGRVAGTLGRRREFLMVRQTKSRKLKPYKMFLGARDYGVHLQVYWYVTYQPTMWEQLIQLLLYIPFVNLAVAPIALASGKWTTKGKEQDPSGGLDLFEISDLTAYVTNAHQCMLQAVDKLLLELGQDPSKINRQSRGFLGIS